MSRSSLHVSIDKHVSLNVYTRLTVFDGPNAGFSLPGAISVPIAKALWWKVDSLSTTDTKPDIVHS